MPPRSAGRTRRIHSCYIFELRALRELRGEMSVVTWLRQSRSSDVPCALHSALCLAVFYKSLIRPLLFLGDPEKTHEQTLALLSRIQPFERLLERLFCVEDDRLHVRVGPLSFPNPVGLAGGFCVNCLAVVATSTRAGDFVDV